MTRNHDFKALVRSRMERTGETYTAARTALEAQSPQWRARWEAAEREQRRLVTRWFDAGRLRAIPTRRKVRAAILLELLGRLEPGTTWSEASVSALLAEIHPDHAWLRRELIAFGYLTREAGVYRLADAPPRRTAAQRAELPEWEALWLPGFLAARAVRR